VGSTPSSGFRGPPSRGDFAAFAQRAGHFPFTYTVVRPRQLSRGASRRIFPSRFATLKVVTRDMFPGECRSGQSGQTVNLLTYVFGGSNPSSPIQFSACFRRKTQVLERQALPVGRACSFLIQTPSITHLCAPDSAPRPSCRLATVPLTRCNTPKHNKQAPPPEGACHLRHP
jgi:hypothetical protein